MFKEMGQALNMLKNLPKLQEEMQKLQTRLGEIFAEGSAGGDMVTARVNGKMELVGCKLSDEAIRLGDREMVEDLIVAAVNDAMAKVRHLVAEETAKSGVMGMPGMGMPPAGE